MNWDYIIGIGCALGGFLISYLAFQRSTRKDVSDGARHDATVLSELGYIKANTDDIKRRQDKQDERHLDTVERLSAVEASAKQAHKRIDSMEERIK